MTPVKREVMDFCLKTRALKEERGHLQNLVKYMFPEHLFIDRDTHEDLRDNFRLVNIHEIDFLNLSNVC